MSLIPYAGHPSLQAAANGADPGEIPESLRRPPLTREQKDALAQKVVEITKAEPKMPEPKPPTPLQEVEKTKARNRIAKLKAKQSGELAKMPLTGKAALAAIAAAGPDLVDPPQTEAAKLPVPPPSAKQDRAKAKDKPKSPPKAAPAKQSAPAAAKKATKASKAPRKAKGAQRAPKATSAGPRPGTKTALVADMLRRPEGCTAAEVMAACSWPAVSMPQQAKAAGLKLRKEKDGKVSRYWAA